MNTKYNWKGLCAALAAVLLCSCSMRYFEEFNKDEFGVDKDAMAQDGLAIGGMLQQLERSVIIYRDGVYLDSDYQIMYNLCADTWCGYLSPALSDGHHAGWDVNDGWHRRMFTVKYEYGMGGYQDFKAAAEELGLENELALATVLKVTTMHQVADYYGPIAYSQSGAITNLYDPLDQVYAQFFDELDGAIETLEKMASSGARILEDYDLIYGGDVTRWVRFANSLRLRLAMRASYADPEKARAEAEKSIRSPYGVVTTNADNAVIAEPGSYHPIQEINISFQDGETRLGASMESYLNGFNDPRKFLYFLPAGDGNLHGVRPGISPSSWDNYKNTAAKVSAPNAGIYKITWLNAAEVAFLRAEGALKGWDMGGTAQEFYEQGIRLSFEEWGAEGITAYLSNTTAQPVEFRDNVQRAHAAAPSTVTIAWNSRDTDEQKLEKIATQKWLALFPNGAEAWAEYRRLHYPVLIPPANNYSNGVVNTNQGIRRVPYPVSEQTDNPEGYASGVAALGGRDDAGVRLWWDAKPFNN